MILGQYEVDEALKEVERKREIWTREFPKLEFDKFGRAIIGYTDISANNLFDMFKEWSWDWRNSFIDYLKEKDYLLAHKYDTYYQDFALYDLDFEQLTDGYFHFKKVDSEKLVKVKMSKVLAGVQNYWVKRSPEYVSMTDTIKSLRALGFTYESSPELRYNTQRKENMEWGNWYFAHQKVSNQTSNKQPLMLSINPLDLLSSSGNEDSTNPTKFGSCWSTRMEIYDDSLRVYDSGCYASVVGMINLGMIANRGIMYTPNGHTLKVPNSDFEIIGYMDRVHVWFDTHSYKSSGIFYEKTYPNRDSFALDKYVDAMKELDAIKIDMPNEISPFNYQDTRQINNFLSDSKNIFLDKTCIDESDQLCMLDVERMDYEYSDGVSNPARNTEFCECCENRHNEDEMTYVEDYGYVCSSCLDDNFFRCEECGEWHHDDNAQSVRGRYGQGYVCQSCAEGFNYCEGYDMFTWFDVYQTCESSGYYSTEWLERNGYVRCEHCDYWTENNNGICDECTEEIEDGEVA